MHAATLFLAMLFGACSARVPARPPVSAAPEPRPEAVAARVLSPWADLADSRIWTEAAPPLPALSHGPPGTHLHVYVNPDAVTAYRSIVVDRPLADGTRVLAVEESARGERLGAALLEKRGGSWLASQLDARGAPLSGDSSACLGCHVQAPTDYLFGVNQRLPATAP